MPVKHYFYFDKSISRKMMGNRLNKSNWEVLRKNAVAGSFAFETTKQEYIANVKKELVYRQRAKMIARIIKKSNIKQIVSLGVGKGILEYYLKMYLPETHIICADYTEEGINKLREYTNCDECKVFDMLEGNYTQFSGNSCILAYRVSTEFSWKQWKNIMKKIYESGAEKMIFVPTEVLSFSELLQQWKKNIENYILGKQMMMCGWKYTKMEFNYFLSNCRKDKKAIRRMIEVDNTIIYECNLKVHEKR